jgi:hypothetical protein
VTVDGVTVDVELAPQPGRLIVRYRVTNRRPAAIWLLDDMLGFGARGLVRTPRALIVGEDTDPRVVRLVRGVERPESSVATVLVPGARLLLEGRTLDGEAETELPLRARHPQDDPRPLIGQRDQVALEIGVLVDEEPALYRTPLEDGGEALRPALTVAPVYARSAVRPLG